MPRMLLGLLVGLSVLALVVGFLLFPAESTPQQQLPFWGVNLAHNGLHSPDGPKPGSMAAFTAAADAGYGIALCLQLTKDGQVVALADDDLENLCGVPGFAGGLEYDELAELSLACSGFSPPKLSQVLAMAGCQVPLLFELKARGRRSDLCLQSWRQLRQYDGDISIQSFDPQIVRWFKRNVPGLLRGQMAVQPYDVKGSLMGYMTSYCFANWLGRPHFIAYKKGPRPLTVRLVERFAMQVVWGAQSEEEAEALERENDTVLFEGYEPDPRFAAIPESWLESPEP